MRPENGNARNFAPRLSGAHNCGRYRFWGAKWRPPLSFYNENPKKLTGGSLFFCIDHFFRSQIGGPSAGCPATRTENKFLALFVPRKPNLQVGGGGGWDLDQIPPRNILSMYLGRDQAHVKGRSTAEWNQPLFRTRTGRHVEGFPSRGCAASGGRGMQTNVRNISGCKTQWAASGRPRGE